MCMGTFDPVERALAFLQLHNKENECPHSCTHEKKTLGF